MKSLRKRLTCVNRSCSLKNDLAIEKVKSAYINKMESKGWYFNKEAALITSGNCFFYYELYLTLYSPNLKNMGDLNLLAKWDLEEVLELTECKSNVTKDGVFVMNQLKSRGWDNISNLKKYTKHSTLEYSCGYSGNYQQSKLVKVF